MQSQINERLCQFGHMVRLQVCVCVWGDVSMSVEEYSCLECVHTCSHMNEAAGSESRSWAVTVAAVSTVVCVMYELIRHRETPFRRGGGIVIRHRFQFFPRPILVLNYVLYLLFLVEFNLPFLSYFFFFSFSLFMGLRGWARLGKYW